VKNAITVNKPRLGDPTGNTATPMPRPRIILFGIAFWYPLGGVVYQFLHYLIGLRRLGYDVYYVEDSGRYVYDPAANDFTEDAVNNVAAVAPMLDAHGFAGRWAFRGHYPGGQCYGMTDAQLDQLYRDADAFLNVTGGQELREEHLRIPRRVYVETDPVVSQIKVAQGDAGTIEQLAAHDCHFTYGENIGRPDCLLPVARFKWQPTRQPVVIDLWTNDFDVSNGPYTTITTWENKGRDIVYNGQTYCWSKHHEFLKFIDLPLRARPKATFELAVGVDEPTGRMLRENGWGLVNSIDVSRDFDRYRRYIQNSRAEFTVAKDQNIRLRSGWFSDRDVCYLAAGRPVITQETGFSNILPTGAGLFGFLSMDQALAAVDRVETDYGSASRSAREVANDCFAAEKVLSSLMNRAGLA
jgi:hypothetical protein